MFFFCCLGGAWAPAQTAKKKYAPAQTAKTKTPEKPNQQKRPDNKKIDTLTIESEYLCGLSWEPVSSNNFQLTSCCLQICDSLNM